EDFDGGFLEWGRPDAAPYDLEQQANDNPGRGEYPRSFDVFFDQVAQAAPDDNRPGSFQINLVAFAEGGFPASAYNIVWSYAQGSASGGRLISDGYMANLLFDDTYLPVAGGLYKIKCELRVPGETTAPPSRTAVAYILLPEAGASFDDWLIQE